MSNVSHTNDDKGVAHVLCSAGIGCIHHSARIDLAASHVFFIDAR